MWKWKKFEGDYLLYGLHGWAKVGKRAVGGWYVALGWRSSMKADRIQHTASKVHAQTIGEGWIADTDV